ncbi:DUF6283 family protein [Nonomuraea sp. NPDC052265]|uniref:DUF6283 family protein n=1 Tax=Nonomuraea sp. NPDC052265 TaxID=3364374 RepID=UPI0037CBA13C
MAAHDQAPEQASATQQSQPPARKDAVKGTGTLEFRSRPCGGERVCPWRRDADLTAYSDEDIRKLIQAGEGDTRGGAYTLEVAEQMFGGHRMSCHLDQPDSAHPLRLCAGWLAVVVPHHVRARLSVLTGQLPLEAICTDATTWPPLVCDVEELLERRAAHLAAPEPGPVPPGAPEADATDGPAGRTSGARP